MLGFSAQANAFIRHIYSFLGGAVVMLGVAGVSPDTQQDIVKAVHQIGDGFTSILAGLGILVPIASGLFARWTAAPKQQIAAVQSLPGVQVVAAGSADTEKPAAKLQSHWLIGALAIALALPAVLGGCTTSASQEVKAQLSTPQGQAAALGSAYALAKAGFAVYAASSAADPAVVAQVTKAMAVSDVAIPKAQAAILAAPNQDAMTVATSAGFAALDVFEKALLTYGVSSTPATPKPAD